MAGPKSINGDSALLASSNNSHCAPPPTPLSRRSSTSPGSIRSPSMAAPPTGATADCMSIVSPTPPAKCSRQRHRRQAAPRLERRRLLALVTVTDDIPSRMTPRRRRFRRAARLAARRPRPMSFAPSSARDGSLIPRLRTRLSTCAPIRNCESRPRGPSRPHQDPRGYIIEALIPWSNLGIHPRLGSEIGFRSRSTISTPQSRARKLLWFPSLRSGRDPSKMQRLRLADNPAPRSTSAAFGDYPRMHRTRISVVRRWLAHCQKSRARPPPRTNEGAPRS